ncbi:glycosyltransferase family 2 protein [Treponema sp.]|uniref:glycosyltransferase family 2 protein n=1 Tax=Treponema sp. TaxID=166 RepID=UPI003F02F981
MKKPLVSICIPVYGTEPVLKRCLDSIALQDFESKEIVIVNDASSGKNSAGENCKKIVSAFSKKNKIPVVYREHRKNLGILETRRDLLSFSSGDYIFYVDSDDYLEGSNAISFLYAEADRTNADIVNSTADAVSDNLEKRSEQQKSIQKKIDKITLGELVGSQISEDCFVHNRHCGFLWGKLIRRTVLEDAFSFIPFTDCTMGEDFCLYFFISVLSKKYLGVKERFYRYSVDDGISSTRAVDDIKSWRRICSAASAFIPVVEFIQSEQGSSLSEALVEKVKFICNSFVANNLKHLELYVVPELKDEAYQMLCEYWGKEYVQLIENVISSREASKNKHS